MSLELTLGLPIYAPHLKADVSLVLDVNLRNLGHYKSLGLPQAIMGYPGLLLEHANTETLLSFKVAVRVGNALHQSCEMTAVFVITPLRNMSVLWPKVREGLWGCVAKMKKWLGGQLSYTALLPGHEIIIQKSCRLLAMLWFPLD